MPWYVIALHHEEHVSPCAISLTSAAIVVAVVTERLGGLMASINVAIRGDWSWRNCAIAVALTRLCWVCVAQCSTAASGIVAARILVAPVAPTALWVSWHVRSWSWRRWGRRHWCWGRRHWCWGRRHWCWGWRRRWRGWGWSWRWCWGNCTIAIALARFRRVGITEGSALPCRIVAACILVAEFAPTALWVSWRIRSWSWRCRHWRWRWHWCWGWGWGRGRGWRW